MTAIELLNEADRHICSAKLQRQLFVTTRSYQVILCGRTAGNMPVINCRTSLLSSDLALFLRKLRIASYAALAAASTFG
jgi:hypothetical protein